MAIPVAIIIPMMDRAGDLDASLPSLLHQDYPDYRVFIIDMGSRDDLDEVLRRHATPSLERIRCDRPERFSFSRTRNTGARASTGDLLLFLNGDNRFTSASALSDIVRDLTAGEGDPAWFASWRQSAGHAPLAAAPGLAVSSSLPRRYAHCHGSPLLVERAVFEQMGGYNELLEDWGYEDTDLIARLELAGFSRVDMAGVDTVPVPDEEEARVRNFANRDRQQTWAINRLLSDYVIRTWGVGCAALSPADIDWIAKTRARYATLPASEAAAPDVRFPWITVLVPNQGDEAALHRTLASMRLQEYPWIETIVIDSAAAGPPPPAGRPVVRVVQAGRASLVIPPDDWLLGSGDVLAWLDAGQVWEPGEARVAVSHLLTHDEVTTIGTTRGVVCAAQGALTRWTHRLRAAQSPPVDAEISSRLGEWFVRETGVAAAPSGEWTLGRCVVTLVYTPETESLSVSVASVERDIQKVWIFVDNTADAAGAPTWGKLGALDASSRTLAGTLRLPRARFQGRVCRLSAKVYFADGSVAFVHRQPPRTIHLRD